MMDKIDMCETFEEVSSKQIFFGKVFVNIGYPFSKVFFKKEDFVLATRITYTKFLGGYNDDDSENRKIFLNNKLVTNKEIDAWDSEDVLNNFIKKYTKDLNEENYFTVKIKTINQLEYIKHLVCLDNYKNIWDVKM